MKKFYSTMLWATLVAAFQLLFTSASAQNLAKGDLAIVGTNRLTSDPFELAIVALSNIPSGRTIYICDYPYSNTSSGFVNTSNTTEGVISWTTNAQVNKGTVLLVRISAASTTPSVSGLPGTVSVSGWTSGVTTSTPAPPGGDNWFIYQGSAPLVPTNFIFGWTNYFVTTTGSAHGWLANGTQVATNTSTSELPPTLTNGTNAVSLAWSTASGGSHGDHNVFTGITSGIKGDVLADICNFNKWLHDEATTYKLTTGSLGTTQNSGVPYFSSFVVNDPPTASAVAHTGTLEAGSTLTGNYTFADINSDSENGSTFRWLRSDNPGGANKAAIGGATAKTYELAAADVGKHISFEVTPRDGTVNGTAVESPLRGPVTAPVLPVGFISLKAERASKGAVLSWRVASETANSSFTIYRRQGNSVAQKIGSVKGGGSHASERSYSFIDTHPLNGYNYYTLSQIDDNGTETELSTAALLYSLSAQALLYPNPAGEKVSLTFTAGLYHRAELLDITGSIKRSKEISTSAGDISFELNSLARGTYIIRLSGDKASETRKFVKE